MSNPLTVGMACYKDFDGVYFTVQALRAYHGDWFDIVVVDNTPDRQPNVAAVVAAVGGEYHHRPDLTGTSAPRDAVFKYAKTPWVMCVDSHVLLERGALEMFRHENGHNLKNLLTGPLVHDDGRGLSTHWRPTTEPGLWGVWDTDPRVRSVDSSSNTFEIPMQGLGLFAMRKQWWVGMHPLSRGFGGEEGYVHEKVRRAGGKNMCSGSLGWRHRFRDVGGWESNPTPYPVHLGDHVWNLLVQHRELGIDALDAIYKDFGSRLPKDHWERLVDEAILKQPWNEPCPTPKPHRVLCVWYSDNTAPEGLLRKSLATVSNAIAWVGCHGRHGADLVAVSWEPIDGVKTVRFNGTRKRSHGAIIEAIRQALATAGSSYDVVCLMEHDVLYPEGYIVKVADAFGANPQAPVVSNLNYIGLSGQGWQPVKERHEPMHQLSMRLDVLRANLERAWNDFRANGSCLVEPQGNRADWVRLPFEPGLGLVPAVHVNHQAGRFTSHGEVCYAPATVQRHGYWGEHKDWWPHAVEPMPSSSAPGCSSCGQPLGTQFPTLAAWYESAKKTPSDFHEHMDTLRRYADQCETVAEVVAWDKPSTVALCASKAQVIHSYSVSKRRSWDRLVALSEGRLVTHESRNGFPPDYEFHGADLVFLDTQHNAAALFPLLEAFRGSVSRYIVVHCTDIYGQTGDDNSPGVIHAIRRFLHSHKDWVAIERNHNNYGLVVLSRVESDRKQPPGFLRKALNYTKALAKHVAAGSQEVPDEVWEARVDECLMCPERALDTCAICGCPVEAKARYATEKCPAIPPKWTTWELKVLKD